MNIDIPLIDKIVFGGIGFLIFGMPIIMVFKDMMKEDRALNDIANKLIQMFNSLFVRKVKDTDLCLLRDLIIISVTEDGISRPAYEAIREIMLKEGIASFKYEQALNCSPNRIKDIYPTDNEQRQTYLLYLIYVMMKGNSNSLKKMAYIEIVAKKLGLSQIDIILNYKAVKTQLLKSSSKNNHTAQWQVKSSRKFTDYEKSLVEKAQVVDSKYGNSVCFFMKNGSTTYVPLDRNAKSQVGDFIDMDTAEIVTLEKQGERDINRIRV